MKQATMLYKVGGDLKLDCGDFSYIIVDSSEVEEKVKEGWFKHPLDSVIDVESIPTRKELEEKASELGIKFDKRVSDKNLSVKIEEALNVLD